MQLEEAVRRIQLAGENPSNSKIGFSGSGTKSAMLPSNATEVISIGEHQGVVAYDPSEYLITAFAGTTIADLSSALAEHQQYLPFDPLFSAEQATLGGTIASGISGPSSMLHGRLRDSLMAIEIIDGLGQRVRGGGRVVKNAAGFDIPKLMLGSCGRFGLIVEATLKVYPRPPVYCTISLPGTLQSLRVLANELQKQAIPLAGLNITTSRQQFSGQNKLVDGDTTLMIRIAGFEAAVEEIKSKLLADLPTTATVIDDRSEEQEVWMGMRKWIEASSSVGRLHVDPRKVGDFLRYAETNGLAGKLLGTHGGLVFWVREQLGDDSSFFGRISDFNAGFVSLRGEYLRFPNAIKNFEDSIQRAFDPNCVFASQQRV